METRRAVVFRHGDRSPIGTFPNDKHRSYWKQGWGQLTQEGMRQEYNLGKLFKKRYGGGTLLGSKYNQSEIVITSSDFDRTLMSAYCVLSGLYPPNGTDQQWNPGLDWQPIPVHTRPQNEDFIISMRSACPRYDKLLSEYSGNSTLTKFMAQHQGLIDKIVNISGLTRDTWGRITDILFCQYVHNLSLPEWKSVLPFDLVQTIRDVSAANFLPTSEMKKMKAGSLLKEMIENMKTTLNTTAHPKVYLYSGHDSTVIALLRVLNVFDKRKPRYSACVMVEFWKTDIDGTPFIRIIHRNETDSNRTITLQIPGCSENCPFRDFVRILANHIPGDIKEECKIENEAQTFAEMLENNLTDGDEDLLLSMKLEDIEYLAASNVSSEIETRKMELNLHNSALDEFIPPPETPCIPRNRGRFHKASEEEIENLFDERQSTNTKKNTAWGLKVFQDWNMEVRGRYMDLATVPCG
ncbi:testicular acid phosphatase homolog isoform X2 [Mizuhopecten yessoensis]|uniref:testicular acid phosphatase homolog isoform X2 n=1 Tax=Mizuhopecten yessoensis TaxID=6573 RepID=UPI000B4589DD|nr:testicular acid phosphatase homolog isoform X2 [Mizuhopecten yessoensis]